MSRRLLPLLVFCLCSIALSPCFGESQADLRRLPQVKTYPFHGQTGYYGYWNPVHARATLHILNPTVAPGEELNLNIIFQYLSGGADRFFNPEFDRLLPLPGVLAAYDAHKRYIGDLLQWNGGSMRGFGPAEWMNIGEDEIIGTRIHWTRLDSPGTYYLQMIYTRLFIATEDEILSNVHQVPDDQGQMHTFDDELLRSNIVTVHVVKNHVAAPTEY